MSEVAMEMLNRMTFKLGSGVASLVLIAGLCLGCGFDSTPAATTNPPMGGTSASAAGTASSGGDTTSASGSPGGGVAAGGTTTTPTGGDAGSGQGGQIAQGGQTATGGGGSGGGGGVTGGSAGTGGMSVAGGPSVWTDKPLLVVAYSPYRDGQGPGGTQPSQDQVKQDLMMLKPYVVGIRVYGTDGANAYIPALCDQLGIDLHLGAWIDGLGTDESNVHALATIVNANHPSIKTAVIGNEVLARATKNLMTEEKLIALIKLFKADLTATTGVKIAAADTYPQWMLMRPNLAAEVDLLIWHTYGWWSGVDISTAYTVVSGRYDDMLKAYPGKSMVLG
ncbi:MAG TPA: hypothetical protein VNG33_17435, partial [Polyangiaceae bacterium]|nr:hypothetical protein [Polyangiaceae bacterium]